MTNLSFEWVVAAIGIAVTVLTLCLLTLLPVLSRRYQASFTQVVGERLTAAWVFLDPRRVFTLQVAVTLLAVVAVLLLTKSFPLALGVALLSGLLPALLLRRLRLQRATLLRSQTPDAMMLMASSLRSGQSLPMALNSVATELAAPISQEFELMLRECRLGLSIDKAFYRIEERNPFEEFKLLGAAIRISLETGGNLAESLEGLAVALRTKLAIEGKLDALTSQGRLQAWVVGALPFVILAILYQLDRPGMMPLFTTYKGLIALGLVLVLQTLGVVVIRKIVRIEV
jgi:tight adherence protein B